MYSRHPEVHGDHVTLWILGYITEISINLQQTNITVIYNSFVNKHQKKVLVPKMCSKMPYTKLSTVSFLSDMRNIGNIKLTTKLYGSNFLND